MRPIVLAAALVVLAGAGLALSWRAASSADPTPPRSAPQTAPVAAEPTSRVAPSHRLSRNPFEYGDGDEGRVRIASPRLVFPSPSPSVTAAATPVVRLVGFLRKGGALHAIVSVTGEVFVLAAGEQANGYTLLTADEETGARLRGPDGSELTLEVPDSSGR